jgi:mitotic spindle assembly checkpoint protein MAD1
MDEPKAEVKASKYAIDNHKQEEELVKLRLESELEDARHEAEDDFDKKQAAETEKSQDVRQYEALQKEVTELKDAAADEEAVLERRVGSQ